MSPWLIKVLHSIGLTNLTDAMVARYAALVSDGRPVSSTGAWSDPDGQEQRERPPFWLSGVAVVAAVIFLLLLASLSPKPGANGSSTQTKLDERLDGLAASLDDVERNLKGAVGRMEAVESSLSQLREGLRSLQSDLAETKKSVPSKDSILAAARGEAKDVASAALAPVVTKQDMMLQTIHDETAARKADSASTAAAIEEVKKQYGALKEPLAATKSNIADLKAAVDRLGHGEITVGRRLAGTWKLVDVSNPSPDTHFDPPRNDVLFNFDIDRLTISFHDKESGDGTLILAFATDPDQEPSRINLHFRREQGEKPFDPKRIDDIAKGHAFLRPFTLPDILGIYKRAGDSLQLCVGETFDTPLRPAELKAGGNAKGVLFRLERVNKD